MYVTRSGFKVQIFLVIFLIMLIALPTYSQFEDPQYLTDGTPSAYWSVAAQGDFVHVVFWDARYGNDEIFYKRSTDGGVTWSQDNRLTNANGISFTPCLSVNGQVVHIVWSDDRDGNFEVYYKVSTDNGVTWGTDIRLTNSSGYSGGPSIVSTPSATHVVWNDNRDGNHEIYYKRGDGAGSTWDPEVRLTSTNERSVHPCLALSGNNVHLVWVESFYINYKRSIDNGNSWDTEIQLSQPSDYMEASQLPSIAASGTDVHVVWMDNRDYSTSGQGIFKYRLFYASSKTSGTTWSAEQAISTDWSSRGQPSIGIHEGDYIHVVWESKPSDTPTNDAIYYLRSFDKGDSWDQRVTLTTSTEELDRPSLSISGNTMHVLWAKDIDYPEIYYSRLLLTPDLDIDDNASDLHNNKMEMKIVTREQRLISKSFDLCNTSFSRNPDPDGPSAFRTLDNVREFRGSPKPVNQNELENLFRPCLGQLGPRDSLSDKRALSAKINASKVTCSSIEGKELEALVIVPRTLELGNPQKGHITVCAPKEQPLGLYQAKVNVRYRSRINPNQTTEDFFLLRVKIAKVRREFLWQPEYGE